MPLAITEEMIRNDPFFKKAKKEDVLNLYKKLNLSPEQIADILNVPVDFVEKVIRETNLEKE